MAKAASQHSKTTAKFLEISREQCILTASIWNIIKNKESGEKKEIRTNFVSQNVSL